MAFFLLSERISNIRDGSLSTEQRGIVVAGTIEEAAQKMGGRRVGNTCVLGGLALHFAVLEGPFFLKEIPEITKLPPTPE